MFSIHDEDDDEEREEETFLMPADRAHTFKIPATLWITSAPYNIERERVMAMAIDL